MEKKLIIITGCLIILGSCSSVKYPYYFDRYLVKKPTFTKNEEAKEDSTRKAEIEINDSFSPLPEKTLASSASKSVILAKRTVNTIGENHAIDFSKKTKVGAKGLAKTSKDFKAYKKAFREAIGGPSKSKNAFAVAGFISSLAGLLLVAYGGPFLLILAIIFSAIGLKSEKRKLAMAGLIISIAALVILFFVILIILSQIETNTANSIDWSKGWNLD